MTCFRCQVLAALCFACLSGSSLTHAGDDNKKTRQRKLPPRICAIDIQESLIKDPYTGFASLRTWLRIEEGSIASLSPAVFNFVARRALNRSTKRFNLDTIEMIREGLLPAKKAVLQLEDLVTKTSGELAGLAQTLSHMKDRHPDPQAFERMAARLRRNAASITVKHSKPGRSATVAERAEYQKWQYLWNQVKTNQGRHNPRYPKEFYEYMRSFTTSAYSVWSEVLVALTYRDVFGVSIPVSTLRKYKFFKDNPIPEDLFNAEVDVLVKVDGRWRIIEVKNYTEGRLFGSNFAAETRQLEKLKRLEAFFDGPVDFALTSMTGFKPIAVEWLRSNGFLLSGPVRLQKKDAHCLLISSEGRD